MPGGQPHDNFLRELDRMRSLFVAGFDDARIYLQEQVRRQANLVDHTLGDLRRLGHPYRLREGGFFRILGKMGPPTSKGRWGGRWSAGIRKKAREIREGQLGHDIKFVHKQSGTLVAAIKSKTFVSGEQLRILVWVDEAEAPHVEWVVKGTTKMIPRDFIGIAHIRARPGILKIIEQKLRPIRRTGALGV